MTGSMAIEGVGRSKYVRLTEDDAWPPKFFKIILEFDGGVKMAFCDARRFGRVKLQADPEQHDPVSKLGFDPVLSMPSLEDFADKLSKNTQAVKSMLLDQVGRWMYVMSLSNEGVLVSRRMPYC